jgi:hypothetical protein
MSENRSQITELPRSGLVQGALCQLADATMSRGQVWTHSTMAKAEFAIPRYPDVTRVHF